MNQITRQNLKYVVPLLAFMFVLAVAFLMLPWWAGLPLLAGFGLCGALLGIATEVPDHDAD